MKKINYIIILLFLGLLILPSSNLLAALCTSGPLGDGDCCAVPGLCNAGCPPCTLVPLDGGLSALLLVGIAFGIKKVKGKK